MTLEDLYNRVVETTGLDIVTIPSLNTAVSNCFADLTSRGYRIFKEIKLADLQNKYFSKNYLKFTQPSDVRKVVYLKVFFSGTALTARRLSISNPTVGCNYIMNEFRSDVPEYSAIFYSKGDEIILEWDSRLGDLINVAYGYYQRLIAPKIDESNITEDNWKKVIVNIRPEFEDAVVFYSAYFYYSRFNKDTEKIVFYQNNYKYYVEDLNHELAYEDSYNENHVIICED